jgi:hypothetical protein
MDNQPVAATAYPPVKLTNSTPYLASSGTVRYLSWSCTNDNYANLQSGHIWTGPPRGICLISEITGIVRTPSGDVVAEPYESSGTSYSNFAIIQIGENKFKITRITEGSEDLRPEGYVEPTTKQK